ncbi:MAG: protein kinase [Cyanobacteria bacterium TGS_CYA1]|nr:protein kinase [Cyanobacteria bacterium TGS_CYA1]
MPELIAERYEIIATIGAGGVGTVYKVFDPLLKKSFAIKVLQRNSDGAKAARLQREAMSAGKLNHPHICRIDNFGQTEDGSPYMVMEYLEGRDLGDILKDEGALELSRALEIAIQVSGALAYAHQYGVIHRDLKPANVLLLKDSSQVFVKLLDFGVAKDETQSGEITQKGVIVGSPLYMSPEQIKGEETGAASDIYSFGCMLFEILTGEPPFKTNSVVETFSEHKNKEAPRLSSVGNFPESLSELLAQCLNKESAQRPLSFTEILKQLEKIQDEVLNPVAEKQSPDDSSSIEQEKSAGKKILLAGSISFVLVMVLLSATFINRDIQTRKVLPESRVSEKTGLNLAADEFFDEKSNRSNLFVPDSKFGNLAKRAVPSVTDADIKLLKGQKFYKLSFDGSQVNGSGLKYIVDSGLRQLRMQQVELTDENMKYIAQMKDLSNLSLYSDFLTDKGLAYISDARKFNALELHSDQITNQGIASIKHLDRCTHLSFRGKSLTIDCIKAIGKSRNLQTLELGKFRVQGDLGSLLMGFPKLQRMDFADIKWIDPESIRSLAKKKIVQVNIMRSVLGSEQLRALSELKELNTISLFKCEVELEGLKNLERSKSLIVFHLTENQNISGKGVVYLSKIKQLNVLNLSKTNITGDDLAQITTMPFLNLIDVKDCLALPKEAIEKFKIDYKARWGRDCTVNT